MMNRENHEPRYVISIAARMIGCPAYTLRYYEKIGIIEPQRTKGRRVYSESDIALLRRVRTLVDDMGVNLAGVEVIMRLMQRMAELQAKLRQCEGITDQMGEE
jgi:MerR family transcriptional regulator/heat shock protein HspR